MALYIDLLLEFWLSEDHLVVIPNLGGITVKLPLLLLLGVQLLSVGHAKITIQNTQEAGHDRLLQKKELFHGICQT
jgi:hypothetical protein